MKRGVFAIGAAVAALAGAPQALAGPCGLPDAKPLWVEYAEGSVQFRASIFRRPGLVLASSGALLPADLRNAGAHTIYWYMHLVNAVGTPAAPADPAGVPAAAASIFDRAVASSGCATPLVALNELHGPTVPAPWNEPTTQYRANVLAFVQELARRGARPFLLVPSNPNTAGSAAMWWQQVAQSADVVREMYFKGPEISAKGAILANRDMRQRMRLAVRAYTDIGIPVTRVGLMLGFQSAGIYGRAGLQPLEKWLEFVKWNALSAKQVAAELGVDTIWSWGWGTFGPGSADPDKPTAACVYLWTRNPSLCDAPALAPRFNTSLTEGQISLRAGVQCSVRGAVISTRAIDQLAALTGDRQVAFTALFARLAQRASAGQVATTTLLAAERRVIARRFAGSRSRYLAALAARGVSVATSRAIIADELRRQALTRRGVGDVAKWTADEQTKLLDVAICLRDELPVTGFVRLADRVQFLRL